MKANINFLTVIDRDPDKVLWRFKPHELNKTTISLPPNLYWYLKHMQNFPSWFPMFEYSYCALKYDTFFIQNITDAKVSDKTKVNIRDMETRKHATFDP